MKRASIAALKAHLSRFLDAVKAGEEIVVTERGRPIARLGPVGAEGQGDARLQHLVRAGLARPPLGKLPKDFWKQPRPKDNAGRSLTVLIEERTESS